MTPDAAPGAERVVGLDPACVEQLVFECLERIESEGPSALEAVCREHAALAHELLERIHALAQRGLIDVAPTEPPAPEAPRSR